MDRATITKIGVLAILAAAYLAGLGGVIYILWLVTKALKKYVGA